MVNIRKFLIGLGLIPNPAGHTADTKGELEVITADSRLFYHDGVSAQPILTDTNTATVTNKSLDGGSNTFTNLPGTAISGQVPVANGGTGASSLTSNGVIIGNGTSAVTVTAEGATNTLLHGNTGADPSFSSVVNADISASAAIAFSKLASLTSAHILVGNGSNVATDVAVSGDIAITNAGVTSYSGTVPVNKGGTGSTSLTNHGVVLGQGTSAVVVTSVGATNTVLHGNTGADPTFSAVDLAADVTGTLPVNKGGTGDATLTNHGVLIGQGTSAVAVTSAGTSGQPLLSGGASADPAYGTLAIGAGGTGQTTKAAAFDALSPMTTSGDIIYGGTSGTGTRLAKGTDGQVLTLASGIPSWAAGGSGSNTVVFSSYALANWPITVNQYGDLASISLTAGTWEITIYNYVYNNGTTNLTTVQTGVSAFSGNNSTSLDQANANFYDQTPWGNTNQNVYMLNVPGVIVTPGSTTTYYLKGYAAGTNTTNLRAGGRISAVKLI